MSHTCAGCNATWTGMNISHCPATGCHATFSTVANFDRHRSDYRCLDPATVGLELIGGLWKMPPTEASRARIAAFALLRRSAEHADLDPTPQPAPTDALRAVSAAPTSTTTSWPS